MNRYFFLSLFLVIAGCSSNIVRPTNLQTLNEQQFAAIYDDHQDFTDVWYMGSSATDHFFCLEHWTIQPDGSSGTMDKRLFCQVAVTEMGVKRPFPLTYDMNQWRVMRPHGDVNAMPQ